MYRGSSARNQCSTGYHISRICFEMHFLRPSMRTLLCACLVCLRPGAVVEIRGLGAAHRTLGSRGVGDRTSGIQREARPPPLLAPTKNGKHSEFSVSSSTAVLSRSTSSLLSAANTPSTPFSGGAFSPPGKRGGRAKSTLGSKDNVPERSLRGVQNAGIQKVSSTRVQGSHHFTISQVLFLTSEK